MWGRGWRCGPAYGYGRGGWRGHPWAGAGQGFGRMGAMAVPMATDDLRQQLEAVRFQLRELEQCIEALAAEHEG